MWWEGRGVEGVGERGYCISVSSVSADLEGKLIRIPNCLGQRTSFPSGSRENRVLGY